MITNFLNALKSSGKLSLVACAAFFVSMLVSAYFLFTLPHNLVLKGGLPTLELAWPVLITLFVSVGLTFVLGIASINTVVKSRKEVVVYLEKKKDDRASAAQREDQAGTSLTDLASFTAELQQAKGEDEILQTALNSICQQVQAGQGAIYRTRSIDGKKVVELKQGFATTVGESTAPQFEWGEGLIGQAAASGKSLYLDEVPEGYITIISGLGTASPRFLFIVPIRKGDEIKGVAEIATFSGLQESHRNRIEEMIQVLGEKIK